MASKRQQTSRGEVYDGYSRDLIVGCRFGTRLLPKVTNDHGSAPGTVRMSDLFAIVECLGFVQLISGAHDGLLIMTVLFCIRFAQDLCFIGGLCRA